MIDNAVRSIISGFKITIVEVFYCDISMRIQRILNILVRKIVVRINVYIIINNIYNLHVLRGSKIIYHCFDTLH